MQYIDKEGIKAYRRRQEAIVDGVIPHVKSGGYLLYVTCSAYRMENEGMVEYVSGKGGMRMLKQASVKGHPEHADTLFAALFTSSV